MSKTILNLCFTAKKGRQRSKNLHRMFKNWVHCYKENKKLELNSIEETILFIYREEIVEKYWR